MPRKSECFERPAHQIEIGRFLEKFPSDFYAESRLPEKGLIIDRHAAVGRQHLSVFGQNQGVDFQRPAVIFLERLKQFKNNGADLAQRISLYTHRQSHVQGVVGH